MDGVVPGVVGGSEKLDRLIGLQTCGRGWESAAVVWETALAPGGIDLWWVEA